LKEGLDIIIPGGWFIVQHSMTFNEEDVQIQEHKCHSPPGVIYDEDLIYNLEAWIIRSISASEPHTQESLSQHIPSEYH
jgi:hypothetical protein